MYTKICDFQPNFGSSGEIYKKDESEIIDSLNNNNYAHRMNLSDAFFNKKVDIDQIVEEIHHELGWQYEDNCHTLVRKFHEKLGCNKVSGYLVKNEDIGNTQIRLHAHSVVKDNNGDLVELTGFWNINSYSFIEHKSGEHGIDLQAS